MNRKPMYKFKKHIINADRIETPHPMMKCIFGTAIVFELFKATLLLYG